MPYGYYTLVRVAACFASVPLAVAVHQRQWKTLGYLLGALGILYNPVIPIHLDRSAWFPINLGTIAALLFSVGVLSWSRGKSAA
jgi:hypothetical protein